MKIRFFFYLIFTASLMLSCATPSFYQIYNVKTNQETIKKANNLFFEDDNCKISYDFWTNGGDIGFRFYNKTDENIYINLNKSNFIKNGFAYDYYKNRTFTNSKSKSTSSSKTSSGSNAITGVNVFNNIQTNKSTRTSSANFGSSVESSVSIKEDSIVLIPPKATKIISEYSINNSLVRSCDLLKHPRINEIKTISYTEEKSPIVFSNRITYKIKGNSKTVENRFFVSEVTNYPEKEFFEYRYSEYCGQRRPPKTKYYKLYDSNKFYIKYTHSYSNH